MPKYQRGDRVLYVDILKQTREGRILDVIPTGGHDAYTIEGCDFIVLEKNVLKRLERARKKKGNDY